MPRDDIPESMTEKFVNLDLRRYQREPLPTFFDLVPRPSPTAEHAEKQIKQNDELVALIGAMKQIAEAQAADAQANAVREAEQQKFNKRMTWVAFLLAAGALVVPFIERAL